MEYWRQHNLGQIPVQPMQVPTQARRPTPSTCSTEAPPPEPAPRPSAAPAQPGPMSVISEAEQQQHALIHETIRQDRLQRARAAFKVELQRTGSLHKATKNLRGMAKDAEEMNYVEEFLAKDTSDSSEDD